MTELENLIQKLTEDKTIKIAETAYEVKNCCSSIGSQTAKLSLVVQKGDELISIFIDVKKFIKH